MDQVKIIAQLLERIDRLERRVVHLEYVEKENSKLREEIGFLREKLSKFENPKNSSNSSIPPSKD